MRFEFFFFYISRNEEHHASYHKMFKGFKVGYNMILDPYKRRYFDNYDMKRQVITQMIF